MITLGIGLLIGIIMTSYFIALRDWFRREDIKNINTK